jgi:hypothetical protein
MAGFSNFTTNQATQSTTMPSWYDKAQQDLVSGATTAGAKVPALANTVAGSAISQLDGTGTNPFTQAQGTLNQIGTGAANPWITDATTGQVTPNTSTALGGLFQAQNQQLNQLAPDLMAVPTAAGTASGQFGSLRTQTAANKALTDAQSKLFADQMQAALQNQQTGVNAATNLGSVAEKGINTATTLGQTQQADPLLASSALAKIIGSMQVGTTQKNTTQLSPLQQIAAIASAVGGSVAGTNKLLSDLGIKGGIPELFKGITGSSYAGSGLGAGLGAGTYDLAGGGGKLVIDATGNRLVTNADGSYERFDKDGNLIDSGNAPTGGNTDEDSGGGGLDTGGGGLDIDTGGGGLNFGGGEGLENGDSSFGLDNQF